MKLSADSPELTAYALGELTPAERAEVEAALAESPELRAELESLHQMVGRLNDEFAAEPAVALSTEQRAAIVGQAAGLPATQADPVEPKVERPGPTWWERFLAWRQQLIWVAAGACALALTFAFWPRQRAILEQANELRYQRLPEPQATAEAVSKDSLDLLERPSPRKPADADNRVPANPAVSSVPPVAVKPPAVNSSALGGAGTRLETVTTTGKTPVQAPSSTPKKAAPVQLADRLSVANPSSSSSTLASAPVPVAPTAPPAATQPQPTTKQLDPILSRRYGLAPQNATAGGAPAAEVPAPGSALRSRYGLATDATGRANRQEMLGEMEAGQRGATPASAGAVVSSEARELGRADAYYRYPVIQPIAPIQPGVGGEGYEAIADNDFKSVASAPLSTFSLDVDTASYANTRRFLREGSLPPRDAVRLEELINYFHYDYPQPKGEHPFLAAIEMAESPWKEGHKLVRIGIQARSIDRRERPAANLVFLVDVSGSMEPENKLPLVKRSLRLLLDKLSERDRVGIVTYAGDSRVAAEPTAVNATGKMKLLSVIEGLRAGSGTHGSAGIQMAYGMATNQFNREHVNRVILCTDGDFNVGITDRGELLNFITEHAKTGVFLSVLGYGMGNYKDGTMELLADKGNGNYAYVDSFTEARKVLSEQLEGTLVTIAKDVKVQVEFNPSRVKSYRLLGYENRALKDREFNDDTKDAGEVGAGHQVTVLYEIEPAIPNLAGVDPLRYQAKPEDEEVKKRLKPEHGEELLNLKLRYKAPDGDVSKLVETPVKDVDREFANGSADFKFAAAVAGYGMLLRQSPHKADLTWDSVSRLAEQGLGEDKEGYRAEFVDLVRRAQQLGGVMPMNEVRPMPAPAPGGRRNKF